MPKRTNVFQRVVTLVYELVADGATVEESVMLEDVETGEEREVDVLVRGQVAGLPIRVQIEATARGGRADVKWVEAELGKHRAVRTNQLVLVSESGFSKAARKKAEANGAVAIEPRDLTSEDGVGEIVNQLGSIWPKVLTLAPTHIYAAVERPNGEVLRATELDLSTLIVTEDGEELCTISEEIKRRMDARFKEVAEDIGLADIAGNCEAFFTFDMPDFVGSVGGEKFHACLRWQPDATKDPEFHRIIEINVRGKAAIGVDEIVLSHKKLGSFLVSYGTGKVGDSDALVVVTEDDSGQRGALWLDPADEEV